MDSENKKNTKIESSAELAFSGSKDAAKVYLQGFLEGPLFIPERYQTYQAVNEADYPNDFINIQALKGDEKTFIPVFSNPQLLEEWANTDLNYKEFKGSKLCNTVPEDWWIVVNPGSSVEKEMSPWEIDVLRGNSNEAIEEVLTELFQDDVVESVKLVDPDDKISNKLRDIFKSEAKNNNFVKRLFLLKELGTTTTGKEKESFLLGIEIAEGQELQFDNIKEKFKKASEIELIGDDELKLRIGTDIKSSVMLGMFKNSVAFYSKL